MSQVFSFRLNRNNPREAKALSILDGKRSEGISVREIITQALLSMNDISASMPTIEPAMLEETLRKINRLIDRDYDHHHAEAVVTHENLDLREEFVLSIQKTVKPGVTLE